MNMTLVEEKPVVPPKKIVIELNEQEAEQLKALMGLLYGEWRIREALQSTYNHGWAKVYTEFSEELVSTSQLAKDIYSDLGKKGIYNR